MKYLIVVMVFFIACNGNTSSEDSVKATGMEHNKAQQVNLVKTVESLVNPDISIDYLMGKFVPSEDQRFTSISATHASNTNMLLRKEAYEAFKSMYEKAKEAGINLKIISATRPFKHQKRIWEAKWNGSRKVEGKDLSKTIIDPAKRALKILEYSSMPGSSRHHWGTDIDINALNNEYFEKGKGKKEYDWLVANAPTFGFCQPYSSKDAQRPNGYNEEKWHWSYLPIAKELTEQYKLRIKNEDIGGFAGAEVAGQIGVVEKYVLGINKACL